MIIHTMPQRSEEWHAVRIGKFTASDFADLMPSSKQKPGEFNKTQMGIIYRVAAERMTGISADGCFISSAMQHGIDTEAEARYAYEMETGQAVLEVGFCEYSEWIGASPDGLVGEGGGLEIKCPDSKTQLRYYYNRMDLVDDYEWQCQGGMLCSDRQWWDLYSYDSRFTDPKYQGILVRVERNDDMIEALCNRLYQAIEKVKEIMS